jgi:hypothetical protein
MVAKNLVKEKYEIITDFIDSNLFKNSMNFINMEPNIIDYYNELPNSVNVIDKMNLEFEELQNKYEQITNKFKIPYKISKSIEEYKKYDNKICIEFKNNVKNILLDKDIGVEVISNSDNLYCGISMKRLKRGLFITYYSKDSLIDKIIDQLDILTDNKNKEWCKKRIDTVFDCFNRHYNNYEDMIDAIINYIFNGNGGNDPECLPEVYNQLCIDVSFPKIKDEDGYIYCPGSSCAGLYSILNFMTCNKCNNLHNDNIEKNLCVECE